MTVFSKEDLKGITHIKETISPNLTELESTIKQYEQSHREENAYKNLNIFANKIYHNLPDFKDSMVGLIGMTKSYLTMLTTFEVYQSEMRQEMEEENKIEIVERGFKDTLPQLIQFTQEIKKYLDDVDKTKLCDSVLTDLFTLQSEVKTLQKKDNLTGEEKTMPSSPKS